MPIVSIIVPCYNEEPTIHKLLHAIYQQTFPLEDLEVVIADGMSKDNTRKEIKRFQQEFSELNIKLVDNPKRIIPAALNRAIEASTGQFIVRLDAHSMPHKEYVARCVEALQAEIGDNVGGIWEIHSGKDTWIARSIAFAASHPLGVGDALYRYASEAAYVDTVPFGSFRRKLFDKIGLFDETLLTNEDYEVNTRIRQGGGRIWLDPAIRSVYFARSSLKDLARQYFRYGYWKLQMLKRYPDTIRWRQALPPVFVVSLFGLLCLSPFWWLARWLFVLEIGLYLLILVGFSLPIAIKNKDIRLAVGIPFAIAAMHLSWGAGFLWSFLKTIKQ